MRALYYSSLLASFVAAIAVAIAIQRKNSTIYGASFPSSLGQYRPRPLFPFWKRRKYRPRQPLRLTRSWQNRLR